MPVRELKQRFESGLSLEAMEVELARGYQFNDVGQMIFAFYLHDMQARGLHQQAGHQSAARYAVDRLSLPLSTAKDLIATGRVLSELPGCNAAFQDGRVGWAKLRLLARIATPETET